MLKLTVSSYKNNPFDKPKIVELTTEGGVIGRADDSVLVLTDEERVVSSRHASIVLDQDQWKIIDMSSNGTYINGAELEVPQSHATALSDGDVLYIGDYKIGVEIIDDQANKALLDDIDLIFDDITKPSNDITLTNEAEQPIDIILPEPESSLSSDRFPGLGDDGLNDWFPEDDNGLYSENNRIVGGGIPDDWNKTFLGNAPDSKPEMADTKPEMADNPPKMDDNPPELDAIAPEIDDDAPTEVNTALMAQIPTMASFKQAPVKKAKAKSSKKKSAKSRTKKSIIKPKVAQQKNTSSQAQTGQPEKTKPGSNKKLPEEEAINPQSATPADHQLDEDENLSAFLKGAGINDAQSQSLTSKQYFLLGQLLNASIQGSMEILSSRAAVKNEFRLKHTMIQPKENNPLKFSMSSEDALDSLLWPKSQHTQDPVSSINEAFDDIRIHQLAVVSGMQQALTLVLKKFNPAILEKRMKKVSVIDSILPQYKKSRIWDLYIELYKELSFEAEDDFQRIFGDSFRQSYEQMVSELKQQ